MIRTFIYKHAALLAILWALIILGLCATPGEYIPSQDWMELLSVDKLVHATLFFILLTIIFLACEKYGKKRFWLAFMFILCVLYGASIEWMQAAFFRNRSMDYKDMIANSVGCIFAFLLMNRTLRYFKYG